MFRNSSYHQSACCPAAFWFSWHLQAFHRMFLLLISVIVTRMSVRLGKQSSLSSVTLSALYAQRYYNSDIPVNKKDTLQKYNYINITSCWITTLQQFVHPISIRPHIDQLSKAVKISLHLSGVINYCAFTT